jgi:hypothetical protein
VPRPIEQLRAICRNPQPYFKLQSKNFFDLAHGQSSGCKLILPFEGEAACHCVVQRRLAWGNHFGEAERCSGIGVKLFGFIAEPVFAFIPESCSRSSRNPVQLAPDSPPTTFFVGRDGKVRSVHAGFVAPATGEFNTLLKREIIRTVEELLAEGKKTIRYRGSIQVRDRACFDDNSYSTPWLWPHCQARQRQN